jgi:two-component system, sensor histidine kinase and response regulator
LVVDDNATNRRVLTAQLGAWGLRCGEAQDGPAAIEILRAAARAGDPFQLAILDMQMPGMDGLALGKVIHADPMHAELKLVLLTSLAHQGGFDEFRDAGFSDWLTKPARQMDLFKRLVGALSPGDAQPSEEAPRPPHAAPQPGANAPRILLAEDNPTNRMVAMAMLAKLGFRVDVAKDGLEAVAAASQNVYDLILMDVQMPGLDGFEATRAIRSGSAGDPSSSGAPATNPDVPIVAMTAHAMVGDREKCLASGMNDYLPKPVNAHDLGNMIAHWIGPNTTSRP